MEVKCFDVVYINYDDEHSYCRLLDILIESMNYCSFGINRVGDVK